MAREIRLSGIGDHFEKQVIITVRKATFKAEKDILKAIENIDVNKANYIIIESKYLQKNSLPEEEVYKSKRKKNKKKIGLEKFCRA